jgi:hypothetical protein
MRQFKWVKCSHQLPPVNVEVMTKIDDDKGCRNEQSLKLYQSSSESRFMWFFPDMSMYVYYAPTHWAYME